MADPISLTSMTVSLPAAQKSFVQERAAATGRSTPSEYIRRLIHADRVATEREALEKLVLEGLGSPAREMTSDDWDRLRAQLRRSVADRGEAS
ncbi:MAG: type II toxin-antitoxin system ParD family antitoxin [Planctomycetes bacterium]|nr:type II toxin-antitoxin system ParD family antitoxin [Planctomycetota bacterium]